MALKMRNHNRISITFIVLSAMSIVFNALVLLSPGQDLDLRLMNMGLSFLSMLLFVASICGTGLPFSIFQIAGVYVMAAFCSFTGSYSWSVLIFSVAIILSYQNGLYDEHRAVRLLVNAVAICIIMCIAIQDKFPLSLIYGVGYTIALSGFVYVLWLILANEKDKEKHLLEILKLSFKTLENAVELAKKGINDDGCK